MKKHNFLLALIIIPTISYSAEKERLISFDQQQAQTIIKIQDDHTIDLEKTARSTKRKRSYRCITPKCSASSKCRITTAAVLFVASLGGLFSDSVAMNNSLMPIEQRASPYNINWEISGLNCATDLVTCTPEDAKRYEKLCHRFSASNTTHQPAIKHQDHRKPTQQTRIRPKNCQQTCALVTNQAECSDIAIQDGQVVYQECTAPKGSDTGANDARFIKDKSEYNTALGSLSTRIATVIFTAVLLGIETSLINLCDIG